MRALKPFLACSFLALAVIGVGAYILFDMLSRNPFRDYGDPNERPPEGVAKALRQPVFYPNAREVNQGSTDREVSAKNLLWSERASFTTDDSPASVLSFYRDHMVTDGWRLVEESPTVVRFVWDYPRQADVGYYFSVLATETITGTQVTIGVQTHQ